MTTQSAMAEISKMYLFAPTRLHFYDFKPKNQRQKRKAKRQTVFKNLSKKL